MKKVIAIITLIMLLCLLFTGCQGTVVDGLDDRFVFVYLDPVKSTRILMDKNTEVLYVWISNGYRAGLSPLYNSDGTIMTYKQFSMED